MAKAKKPHEARALVDLRIGDEFIPCGKTFSADPDTVAALVQSGQACDAPGSIAAGKEPEAAQ